MKWQSSWRRNIEMKAGGVNEINGVNGVLNNGVIWRNGNGINNVNNNVNIMKMSMAYQWRNINNQ
jgi:hypothetical protein